MVDLNVNLGRNVASSREVLEVLRPQLRLAAVTFPAINAAFLSSAFVAPGQDEEPSLGSDDQAASDAMFDALVEDSLEAVKQWAGDVSKVYDKDRMREFIGAALNECANGDPSDAVLDVLALDDGVSESIGHTLKALSAPWDLERGGPRDLRLLGSSASYFTRV